MPLPLNSGALASQLCYFYPFFFFSLPWKLEIMHLRMGTQCKTNNKNTRAGPFSFKTDKFSRSEPPSMQLNGLFRPIRMIVRSVLREHTRKISMYLWAGHNSNMQSSFTWGPYCRGTTQRGFLVRVSSSHGKNKMSRWLGRGMLSFLKNISPKTKQNNPHVLLFYSNFGRTKTRQGRTGLSFLAAD